MPNFRDMPPERQRELAAAGGRAVPAEKRTFSRSPEIAVQSGRLGGQSVAPENRTFSRSPEMARAASRKAVAKRAAMKAAKAAETIGSFIAVLLVLAAFWASFFLIPCGEAMAATPDAPRSIAEEAARGVMIFVLAIIGSAVIYSAHKTARRAYAQRQFEAIVARSSMLLDTEVNGDPSTLGRKL